jgi:hypothetical protein
MPLTEKEAAALERLEAERARRINEKIEKGEAVRMPVLIVGSRESIAAVRARTLAAMRAAGEKREAICCDDILITGVPRPGREPENYSPPNVPEAPAPSVLSRRTTSDCPVSEPRAAVEQRAQHAATAEPWRRVWVTVERPSETNPGGVIAEGLYRVEDGMVKVTDLQARLLGTQPIKPDDDVEAAARKILREKRASAFYDPIQYPRRSMH